jgi:hypothetical protein
MEEIIAPVNRKEILKELTADTFLKNTSKAGNQLYLVNHKNAPNVVREIGRLRELAFRAAGGGTGKSIDLDDYDLSDHPYDQLVVWDPEDQEITAGYRLIKCADADKDDKGHLISATAHLFHLSDKFNEVYIPITLELGRSFVQPKYQRGAARKGLFALDNLWDGLATIVLINPHLKYFFGKVTMYPEYNKEARNILLAFLRKYFPDPEDLVVPRKPLVSAEKLETEAQRFSNLPYKEAHQLLVKELKERGENVPPLINSYMGLTPTMKTFGTAPNYEFGEVEETGILVKFADIDPSRKERYKEGFLEGKEFPGPLHVSRAKTD